MGPLHRLFCVSLESAVQSGSHKRSSRLGTAVRAAKRLHGSLLYVGASEALSCSPFRFDAASCRGSAKAVYSQAIPEAHVVVCHCREALLQDFLGVLGERARTRTKSMFSFKASA